MPQVRRGVDDRDEELVAIMGWCPSHAMADAQQHPTSCLCSEEMTDVDTAIASMTLDEEQDSKGNNSRHADRETLGDTDMPEEGACREFYSSASRFPFSNSPPLPIQQQRQTHPLQQETDVTLLACTPPSRSCNPQAFNFQPSPILSPTPMNFHWNPRTVFSLTRQPYDTELGLLSISPPLKL